MHGLLRTGKEANVYGGRYVTRDGPSVECVIKIFRTTLAGFRNRSEYVKGDCRFPPEVVKKVSNRS